MKKTLLGFVVLGLFAFAGCDQGVPGGPGATNRTEKKPVVARANDTFTLGVPSLAISLKQGEAKATSISIRRGTSFDEDVTLSFANVPQGVSIEPASAVVTNSDKEGKITIKAADDATVGDFTIKVMGHPTRGADALNEFRLTVHKK